MNPKQLAELEVWLAAGFDLPSAMAAVQGVGEEDEGEIQPDEYPRPTPAEPSAWNYFAAFVGLALAAAVLWLIL